MQGDVVDGRLRQGRQQHGDGGARRDGDALPGGRLEPAVGAEQLQVDDGGGVVGVRQMDVVLAALGGARAREPERRVGRRARRAVQPAAAARAHGRGLLRGPAGRERAVGGAEEGGGVGAVRGGGDGPAGLLQGEHGLGGILVGRLGPGRLGVLLRIGLRVRLGVGPGVRLLRLVLLQVGPRRARRRQQVRRGLRRRAALAGRRERGVRRLPHVGRRGRRAQQRRPLHRHPGRQLRGRTAALRGRVEGGDARDDGERGRGGEQGQSRAVHCCSLPSRWGRSPPPYVVSWGCRRP